MSSSLLTLAGVAMILFGQAVTGNQTALQEMRRDLTGQMPTGTASVTGIVTAADTGRPVDSASLSLIRDGGRPVRVVTDADGAFTFTALPAGRYHLTAEKSGYLKVELGQHHPGSGRPGAPFELVDGQRLTGVALSLPRGGGIAGVVVDDRGDPVSGLRVTALHEDWQTGARRLASAASATTDDRGHYRIAPLAPREYVVTVAPDFSRASALAEQEMRMVELSARAASRGMPVPEMPAASPPDKEPGRGYAASYYPDSTIADAAARVTVAAGQDREGIDFHLQPVALAHVSGRLSGSGNAIGSGLTMVRAIEVSGPPGRMPRVARVGPDGAFTLRDLPPGQYRVTAQTMTIRRSDADTPPAPRLFGSADVTVSGSSIDEVVVSMAEGVRVSGRLTFEGDAPVTDVSRVRVRLSTNETAPTPSVVQPDDDGAFELTGVPPGHYRFEVTGLPGGWALTSAILDGRETLDDDVEIDGSRNRPGAVLAVSNRLTEVAGIVQDAGGQPTSRYTVVVFTADQRYWTGGTRRVQAVRTATDGRYAVRGLPPGRYRIAAVFDPEPGRWFDPDFLRQLMGASIPVEIGEGGQRIQDVRVAGGGVS